MLFKILDTFEKLFTSWTILMVTSLRERTPQTVRLIMCLWLMMTVIQWISFLVSTTRFLYRVLKLLIELRRPLLAMSLLLWTTSKKLLQITALLSMGIWSRCSNIIVLLKRWMSET
ncbi:TPA_asm: P overlapped [Arctium alphacytorhabdovirus 1]|nr:TPA_asm: P overlapped [Arctium alphacytorhabdovirus 1]